MTDNAVLAQFIDTAERGTELAVGAGAIAIDEARPAIQFEAQAAEVHKKVTALLAQGHDTATLGQVTILLNNLKIQADALVASGEIGVKNPKTQQSITADIDSIGTMVEAVVSDIELFQASRFQGEQP